VAVVFSKWLESYFDNSVLKIRSKILHTVRGGNQQQIADLKRSRSDAILIAARVFVEVYKSISK